MKVLPILLLLLIPLFLSGQCPYYHKYINRGDSIMKKGDKVDFEAAINAYNTALVHCPSRAEATQKKIIAVFQKIKQLKDNAEQALVDLKKEQARTKGLLVATEQAREAADIALQQAKKLIKAFYFYEGRFALAYGEKNYKNVFYFIDKNGDAVEKLGRWNKAEQFDGRGFARVQKQDVNFLLDTLGNTYQVADDVKNLDPEVTALDLSNKKLDSVPAAVYGHLPLKILLLNNNPIAQLGTQIGNLKELFFLDLSATKIDSLPSTMGNLMKLQSLNLRYSTIKSLPHSIGNLTQLQSLNLTYSKAIKSLPTSIGKLTQLKSLNLGSTNIDSLPNSIGNLKQLQSLDLSYSSIKSLPHSIGNLTQLQTLGLSFTKIDSLPDSIGNLTKLQSLSLIETLIKELPITFSNLKQLRVCTIGRFILSSSNNRISEIMPWCNFIILSTAYSDDFIR